MAINKTIVVCLTFIVGLMTSLNTSAATGFDQLARMSNAFDVLSYDGVFVYSQDQDMHSMRIRHGLIGGVEYESLADLDGQRHEVIRVDGTSLCVSPDFTPYANQPAVARPFNQFRQLDPVQLAQIYQAKIDQQETFVAARAATRVRLEPVDEARYGHQFWLDQETGFLLKHDVINADGKLLERTQFTNITFNPDFNAEKFTDYDSQRVQVLNDAAELETTAQWTFKWLPSGVTPVWKQGQSLPNGTHMMLLSDGLANISVFAIALTQHSSANAAKSPLEGTIMSAGATNVVEHQVKAKQGTYVVTAVGEFPAHTIEKILQNIELKGAL